MKIDKKSKFSLPKLKMILLCTLVFSFDNLAQTDKKQPDDFVTFRKASVGELQIKTEAHNKLWGMSRATRWDLVQEDGILLFSFPDGINAKAPAQIIGTYNSKDGTWLWAWSNPSIVEVLKKDALKVREYGEKNGIEQLTKAKWSGTEEDAWAMTAVAVKLCGAQGAYRGSAGTSLFVFMTFGEVELSSK